MIQFIRVLLAILCLETAICGFLIARRMALPKPVLPQVELVDPVINQEFRNLAKNAEVGTSTDWLALGQALLGQGFYPYAEICFRRSYELDSQNLDAQNGIAFCLDRTGRTTEAIKIYKEVIEKVDGAKREFCQYAVGCNLLREGKIDEAEEVFFNIPDSPKADYQYAKILIRDGRNKRALEVLAHAQKTMPNSLKLYHQQSLAYEAVGETQKVIIASENENRASYVVETLYNTSYVTPYSMNYGFSHEVNKFNDLTKNDDMDQLAEEIQRLIAMMKKEGQFPFYREVLKNAVKIEIRRSDSEKASSFLNQISRLGIDDAEYLVLKGRVFELTGEETKMVAAWENAAQMDSVAETHQKLADYYKKQKNDSKMNYHLAKISSIEGQQKFHKNKLSEATGSFHKSLSLNPNDEHVWFYHAETLRLLGDKENAKTSYERCLKLNPYNGRALTQLKRMKKE